MSERSDTPRPRCRDCGDRNGTCYDGTPCDPREVAAKSSPAPGVVEVPVEPTQEMLDALAEATRPLPGESRDWKIRFTKAYQAMLRAAQEKANGRK